MKENIRFKGLAFNGDEQQAEHGELSLCGNMEIHDGALRPSVLKGTTLGGGQDFPGKLLYVHVTSSGVTNFITSVFHNDQPHTTGLYLEWYMENEDNSGWLSGEIMTPANFGGATPYFNSISSVGNTLCIMTSAGLWYALFKDEDYILLGLQPPFAEIQFNLKDMTDVKEDGTIMSQEESKKDGIMREYDIHLGDMGVGLIEEVYRVFYEYIPLDDEFSEKSLVDTLRQTVTEQVMGIVNQRISEASEKKLFYAPFLVRYCYRLFDGSMIMHSAPVLMTPSLERSVMVNIMGLTFRESGNLYINNFEDSFKVRLTMLLGKLQARWMNSTINDKLQLWKDIVKSVDVFISPQFSRIDTAGMIEKAEAGRKAVWKDAYEHECAIHSLMDGIDGNTMSESYKRGRFGAMFNINSALTSDDDKTYNNSYILSLPEYSEDEHLYKIKNASSFFRIASFKTEDLLDNLFDAVNNNHIDIELDTATLYDISTQEQMTDDYKTHNLLGPSENGTGGLLYTYNHRLNVYGMQEKLFYGFSPSVLFAYVKNDTDHNQDTPFEIKEIDVIIKDGAETKKVVNGDHEASGYSMGWAFDWQLKYFFYPDSRAVFALIWDSSWSQQNDNPKYYLTLADHPTLNGAAYEKTVDGSAQYERYKGGGFSNFSSLRSKIYTSKVDNPFYFPNLPGESGINTVGIGDIIGIAAVTRALSQGQVGDHDLVVFATDGIWVMKVSSTGTYSALHNISREVCDNADSICQLDQSIIFATKRSLSRFRESDVVSISDALDGPVFNCYEKLRSFYDLFYQSPGTDNPDPHKKMIQKLLDFGTPALDLFRTGKVIYDYTSSRLLVFENGANPGDIALAFSLRDMTWSTLFTDYVYAAVPGYPSPYVQRKGQIEVVNETTHQTGLVDVSQLIRLDLPYDYDDGAYTDGVIITRTLTYSDTMDVIRGFRQYGECGNLPMLHFFGSNDQASWRYIGYSARPYHNYMPGHPFRFFRVAAVFSMKMKEKYQSLALEVINKYAKL